MLEITFPFHGAILSHRHGQQDAAGLTIAVRGQAPAGARVTVNGVPARRDGAAFEAAVTLTAPETDLVAVAVGGARSPSAPGGTDASARSPYPPHTVRVVWDRHSRPRYRFSIDDNSFFLLDIARKGYRSLFDCFYLALLRDLHARYGTKFTVNIYYTTAQEYPGDTFALPEFPDRYRGEWTDNADWLRLTFHARQNLPDRPYENAPPAQLARDFDAVHDEIVRFAGAAAWCPPTVIHWALVRPDALGVLTARGVKALSGMFSRRPDGRYDIGYGLDPVRAAHVARHDCLKDFATGIVFSNADIICNNTPVANVAPLLAPLMRDPNRAEIMDLFTHEQYFWPFYQRYLPDHPARVEAAIRFCTEAGYAPVFFHEGLLGGLE